MLSILVGFGCEYITNGLACYYERAVVVALLIWRLEAIANGTEDCISVRIKERDLTLGNDRDIIRFFKKRIKCSCLNESTSKDGNVHHCKARKERKNLWCVVLVE